MHTLVEDISTWAWVLMQTIIPCCSSCVVQILWLVVTRFGDLRRRLAKPPWQFDCGSGTAGTTSTAFGTGWEPQYSRCAYLLEGWFVLNLEFANWGVGRIPWLIRFSLVPMLYEGWSKFDLLPGLVLPCWGSFINGIVLGLYFLSSQWYDFMNFMLLSLLLLKNAFSSVDAALCSCATLYCCARNGFRYPRYVISLT